MEVVQIRITNSTCKRMIRTKSGVQLVPYCSFTCYRTQSDALFGKTLIVGMPRLTEVERGQAISQLMQGHTQRQVAMQFGVNARTIERLVIRLRVTGRVTDRPQSVHPRVTPRREDQAIAFARSSHYGHQNCSQHHRHPQNCKESAERCQSLCASSLR